MKGLLVLVLAAVVVTLGILALTTLLLPDQEVEGHPANGATEPSDPPVAPGRHLEISGDRTGMVTGLDSGELTLSLEGDLDDGFYIDTMIFDGLNFFLDPEACPLVHDSTSLASAQLRFTASCADITDVHGNNTIDIEGWTTMDAFSVLPPGGPRTGGPLEVTGDIESEIETGPAVWYVSSGGDPRAALLMVGDDSGEGEVLEFQPVVGFQLDETGQPSLRFVEIGFGNLFSPEPGHCVIETENIERVDEAIERVELTIDCPSLTSQDFTQAIAVRGTIVVDRVTLDTDDASPES